MNQNLRSLLPAVALCALLASVQPARADAAVPGLPTKDQVARAVNEGRLADAESMIDRVVAADPNSSEAHYFKAQILVREGRADGAEQELATAERLRPGLPYVGADHVRNLRMRIAEASGRGPARVQQVAPVASVAPHEESSFPWGVVIIVFGAGVLLFLILRARQQSVQVVTGPGGYGPAGSYGGGMPYGGGPVVMGGGGGIGSGIVGGLATGAAIGAGMVAGEALAHNLMGDRRDGGYSGGSAPMDGGGAPPVYDDSGQDFGVSDASSGWDGGGSGGGIADSGGGDFGGGGGGGDWG